MSEKHLYFNICTRITIGEKYQILNKIESISIENSLENLSDIATVVIPRKTIYRHHDKNKVFDTQKELINYINVGDKIKIEAGYDEDYQTEFIGYISELTDSIPVKISCTDEMYKLKKSERLNHTFKNADLKDILRFIAPGYSIETFTACPIGKYIIEKATPFEVLQNLKEKFMIRSYFKDGVLCAGLPINLTGYQSHDFNMSRNVRDSTNLVYDKNDQKQYYVKITAKEIGTSKPITYEIGTKGENNKEININTGLTKEQLKILATDIHKGVVNTKCTGTFDSWAIPRTRAGDSANINNPNFPDKSRNGKFLIESVKIDINDSDGFKRSNKIGFKIS